MVTNSDPAVNAAVIVLFSDAFHMHCIWHISQNLLKQLKGKLDSGFSDFMKSFYTARNSLRKEQFNERYYYCIHSFFFFYLLFISLYYNSNFYYISIV